MHGATSILDGLVCVRNLQLSFICVSKSYKHKRRTLSNHSVQSIVWSIAASSLSTSINQPRLNKLIHFRPIQTTSYNVETIFFLKGCNSVNQLPTDHPHIKHLTVWPMTSNHWSNDQLSGKQAKRQNTNSSRINLSVPLFNNSLCPKKKPHHTYMAFYQVVKCQVGVGGDRNRPPSDEIMWPDAQDTRWQGKQFNFIA